MPRIPILTSDIQPRVSQFPRRVPIGIDIAPGEGFAVQGFEELTRFGGKMVQIADAFQRSKDELELLNLRGEYDGQVKNAALEVQADPEYTAQPKRFLEKAETIQKDILAKTTRTPVRQALEGYFGKTLPTQIVEVKDGALKLMRQSIVADMDRSEDALSRKAGEGTPDERNEAIKEYADIVTRNESRGVINPIDAEKRRQSFREKSLERNMDILRRTDRKQLRELDRKGAFDDLATEKRLKILEAARQDEEAEERREERHFNKAKEVVEQYYSSLANFGSIAESELQDMLVGKHPFISPDKARQLQQVNESPPTGQGNIQVRTIMQEYYSGARTQERIDRTRSELRRLATSRPSTVLSKAFNELQADEMGMRGVQAAEINAGIQWAGNAYDTMVGPILPGKLGTFQRNQAQAEKAEINKRIREGENPQKVLDEIQKRKEAERDLVPERNQGVMELTR